jgi:hypothetical protein
MATQQKTGDLVRVAHAQNEAEAALLQGLLRQIGVESLVRRSGAADVPDLLAAGGRDVLVAVRDVPRAQEVLVADDLPPLADDPGLNPQPSRLLVGLLLALAVVAGVICVAADVL